MFTLDRYPAAQITKKGRLTHVELVGVGDADGAEGRHVEPAVRRRQVDGRADGRSEARQRRLPLPATPTRRGRCEQRGAVQSTHKLNFATA